MRDLSLRTWLNVGIVVLATLASMLGIAYGPYETGPEGMALLIVRMIPLVLGILGLLLYGLFRWLAPGAAFMATLLTVVCLGLVVGGMYWG